MRSKTANSHCNRTFLSSSSELPVKWVKELEPDTTCMKGQPMYLTCELNKERDVVWRRNGQVLKKKAGKIAINIIGLQHAVTIQNATEEDAGAYTCEVDGQDEVKTSTNVKVIGEQPDFFNLDIDPMEKKYFLATISIASWTAILMKLLAKFLNLLNQLSCVQRLLRTGL